VRLIAVMKCPEKGSPEQAREAYILEGLEGGNRCPQRNTFMDGNDAHPG
jgi:hypothetical protein